jgi:hypothetical protein
MTWTVIFKFLAALIAALGGGAALVFGLSSSLGKVWADRALEKEKHKYADILQTAKSDLDRAANRYQVELDSLTLIHKLRTTEEFTRLGELWKRIAILQDAFTATAGLGLSIVPADNHEASRYKARLRQDYESALLDARNFFLQEKLFIPRHIADTAETTIGAAVKEKNFCDLFAKHHESGVRSQYLENLQTFVADFKTGMQNLEKEMREHIEGSRKA